MRTRRRLLIALIVLTAPALGGSAILVHAEEDSQNHATAVLINTSENEVGQATFTQNDGSVEVHVEVHDLSPASTVSTSTKMAYAIPRLLSHSAAQGTT